MQNIYKNLSVLPVKDFSILDFHYPIFADAETIVAKYCSNTIRIVKRMEG